jgi:hypothetical protein
MKVAQCLCAIAVLVSGINCRNLQVPTEQTAGFAQVKPILERRCLPCHQGNYLGTPILDLRTADAVFDPKRLPRIVIPGKPEQSFLMMKVHLVEDTDGSMPPLGHGLLPEEKTLLEEWIRQGADWPKGETMTSAAIRDARQIQ